MKRNVMKRAHEIARTLIGDWYARLSLALRQAWREVKNMANKKKQLVVSKNYGGIFGLDEKAGKKMIYNGGISWTAVEGERTMTMDSQMTTDNALEYINRPSYGTGII